MAIKDRILIITNEEDAKRVDEILNKKGPNLKALEAKKKIEEHHFITEYITGDGQTGITESSYKDSGIECINKEDSDERNINSCTN